MKDAEIPKGGSGKISRGFENASKHWPRCIYRWEIEYREVQEDAVSFRLGRKWSRISIAFHVTVKRGGGGGGRGATKMALFYKIHSLENLSLLNRQIDSFHSHIYIHLFLFFYLTLVFSIFQRQKIQKK